MVAGLGAGAAGLGGGDGAGVVRAASGSPAAGVGAAAFAGEPAFGPMGGVDLAAGAACLGWTGRDPTTGAAGTGRAGGGGGA